MSAETVKNPPLIKLKEIGERSKPYSATGVVLWFKAMKGYGFILETIRGRKVFVHHENIESESEFKVLQSGDIVKCSVELTPKGWAAVDVIRTGSSEVAYVEKKACATERGTLNSLPGE